MACVASPPSSFWFCVVKYGSRQHKPELLDGSEFRIGGRVKCVDSLIECLGDMLPRTPAGDHGKESSHDRCLGL